MRVGKTNVPVTMQNIALLDAIRYGLSAEKTDEPIRLNLMGSCEIKFGCWCGYTAIALLII